MKRKNRVSYNLCFLLMFRKELRCFMMLFLSEKTSVAPEQGHLRFQDTPKKPLNTFQGIKTFLKLNQLIHFVDVNRQPGGYVALEGVPKLIKNV